MPKTRHPNCFQIDFNNTKKGENKAKLSWRSVKHILTNNSRLLVYLFICRASLLSLYFLVNSVIVNLHNHITPTRSHRDYGVVLDLREVQTKKKGNGLLMEVLKVFTILVTQFIEVGLRIFVLRHDAGFSHVNLFIKGCQLCHQVCAGLGQLLYLMGAAFQLGLLVIYFTIK